MDNARGLLLDIGGVVLRGAPSMLPVLVAEDPRFADVVARLGVATDRDELWQRMIAHEVSERAYWEQRAADLGAAVGEKWDTRRMINRMYRRPEPDYVVAPVLALMIEVKNAGLPLGALTNDLEDFHGQEWVNEQSWLRHFDVVVDASTTGVMKPDPRAFAAGADALGLPAPDIVYLDDMPWNVEGGLRAGLQAIEVRYADPGAAVAEARSRLGLLFATRGT